MEKVVAVRTRPLRVVLGRDWGPEVRSVGVVVVEVDTSDGVTGYGFSWTPTIGLSAVRALLDDEIASFAVGRVADPRVGWSRLWTHLHEAGGAGVTTIALAGLDLALWDAAGRRAGETISGLLGRRREKVPVYGSGINLHLDDNDLADQARRWVRAGYGAVKIKVGRRDLDEDIARVAAVREILGSQRGLRLDANQRWDLTHAVDAMRELAPFNPEWIEEPLRADDLRGYRALRERTDLPIAVGENLHTRYRVEEYLSAGVCDIVQPNVVRVGGITPFLEIADVVGSAGARLAPHLLPEVSAQLAFHLAEEVEVEDVEGAGFAQLGVLESRPPVRVDAAGARLCADAEAGLGLRFRNDGSPGGQRKREGIS